jgi:hypothetical protein
LHNRRQRRKKCRDHWNWQNGSFAVDRTVHLRMAEAVYLW